MSARRPYLGVDLHAAAGDLAHKSEPLDFTHVYETWFDPCVRWLRALGIPDADLEDVGQEVFVVVRRKLGQFEIAKEQKRRDEGLRNCHRLL